MPGASVWFGSVTGSRREHRRGGELMGSDIAGTGLPWIEAIAQSFEPYSFEEFHCVVLPDLIADNGHLVVEDLRGVPPLSFRVDDRAFTWLVNDDGVQISDGDEEAATAVVLSEQTFSEFLHELLTASGAVRTGRATMSRGALAGWQRWEPAIQSLCTGREIYSPAVWD